MPELPKTFDPAQIEARWYAHWEQNGLFRPERPGAEPWTIVNPPPNVTGSLHIGHALDNTLQDILVRHARLQGKDALWVVGTDHAGIATQMVVERDLALEQKKRTDFTRDAFVARVWDWKAQSGGAITAQLRRLGCSMDWANERFTMDPGFSAAVRHVFVQLHREGLLYRDKRLVNWDPKLQTAISDLEVEQREVRGHFWHFRYPLEDGSGFIAIATTRPETILGDGAVAVNPADERYAHLVGKRCRLPIVDRLIPIIADDYVKMDFGSGAVKITAAHDHNDYEVYKRHPEAGIPLINLMNADATMNGNCPPAYVGLDRYAARAKVVADFDSLGLLDKVEDHVHQVPFGDRSGVVIEPWLTDQWYVDAATLARPAIEAVRSGGIRIVPKTWEKTFFNWMENIQPWCVSRQLWWGHRIPAWYGDEFQIEMDGKARLTGKREFVADDEAKAIDQANVYLDSLKAQSDLFAASSVEIVEHDWENEDSALMDRGNYPIYRDPDVLDTWFSSALWPFATLGWQNEDKAEPFVPSEVEGLSAAGASTALGTNGDGSDGFLNRRSHLRGRYPNDVLVSGFDILFFWDARMMMQGLHFLKDVPFRTLYLHGLVRAADGQKMSKSKGNTVDPLGLIDRYGADALRFFMAAMESQGRDIKMDERRVEGYRNFATKLWNAARFAQANGIGGSTTLEPPKATLPVNQWIIAECVAAIQAVDLALADYRFDAAADAIYHFVWSRFCDWYLELIKPVLQAGAPDPVRPEPVEGQPAVRSEDGLRQAQAEREEVRAVAGWVLDQVLVVLHPFMPFITEELWHALAPREHELIVARWPRADARAIEPGAAAEIEWLIRLVSEVRAARTELNVPPGAFLQLSVSGAENDTKRRLANNADTLQRLARVKDIALIGSDPAAGVSAQLVVDEATYKLALEGVIDLAAERARLTKAVATAAKDRDALAARLGNPSFTERAKLEAVDKARADHAERAAEAERLEAALARLG